MTQKLTFISILVAGLKASGVSVVLNLIVFFVFQSAGVITDDIMIQPGQALTPMPVVISSILPSLMGVGVFFLCEKFSSSGWKIFRIIALVIFLLTLANPFFLIPGVTVAYAIVLDGMHVVVLTVLLYFLGKLQVK